MIRPIDLIPSHRLERRRRRRREAGWRLALIAYGSAVAVGVFALNWGGGGRVGAERGELVRTQAELGETLGSIERLGLRMEELRPSLAVVRAAEASPDWSALLRLVSEARTESLALRRMKLETSGSEERPTASFALEIGGVAGSQSELNKFVLALEGAGVFASVRLRESRRARVGSEEVAEFVVEASLVDGPAEGEGSEE